VRLHIPQIVSVLGPDGVGKSAIVQGIVERLDSDNIEFRHGTMRPALVGSLRRVPIDHTKPHDKALRSLAESVFRVTVKFVYLLGSHARDKLPNSKHTIVLRERGFFDYAVDTKRYGLDPRIRRYALALGRVFPKSDLALLLAGDPAAIYERKPELQPDVIEQLIADWRRVGRIGSRVAVTVETTSRPIDSSIDEAVDALVDHLDLADVSTGRRGVSTNAGREYRSPVRR